MVWISIGAEDRARTGHPDLGKVVLYQMSYFRILKNLSGEANLPAGRQVFLREAKITIVLFLQNLNSLIYTSVCTTYYQAL